MVSRRKFIAASSAAIAAEALLLASRRASAQHEGHGVEHDPKGETQLPRRGASTYSPRGQTPGRPGRDYTPVIVPNGTTLPWTISKGVKIFHLIAEPVEHEMVAGLKLECWGYNGRTPGPVIEVVEGDHVRIYVTNKLPEATTVHWHGVLLPNGMDGVAGLTQKYIQPGQTYKYEFVLKTPGTFMYHPHFDEMTQMGLGMMGMFIVHPRNPRGPKVDRDFVLLSSEWFVEHGARRPNPMAMSDFNMLTFNSVAFPSTEPLVARVGDRVRIRLGNLSAMDHHPIHLHGYSFKVVATDGGPIPSAGQWPETTVLVPVGGTRDIEFVADVPGDWAMHCHMTHHVMNQMGHDTPNMIGVDRKAIDRRVKPLVPSYMTMGDNGMGGHGAHMKHMKVPENSVPMKGGKGPFAFIDMGGMFTVLKVRERLKTYDDPGWYEHPSGEVASLASEEDLRRDNVSTGVKPESGEDHDHGEGA